MNAILEALDREPLEVLHKTLRRLEVFQRFVQAKYLPRPESDSQSLSADGQEALEAVMVDEKRISAAAWSWRRLSEEERRVVLQVAEKMWPGDYERLEEEMSLRLN